MRIHGFGDYARDRRKTDAAVEKLGHRDFVRRIQDNRRAAFGLERAVGERETRKGVGIGPMKFEPACLDEIERRKRPRPPVRLGKRIFNRQPLVHNPRPH